MPDVLPLALVGRIGCLERAPFFFAEYLQEVEPPRWTTARKEAARWNYLEADRVARRLSDGVATCFALVLPAAEEIAKSYPPRERRRAQAVPGEDWRARAANCGVE